MGAGLGVLTVRLAVLVSGGGTTLQNFLDRIADGSLDASIEVVVSSNSTAFALERAKAAGIDGHVVRRRDFETQEAFSDAVTAALEGYDFDLIALAGYTQRYIFPKQYEGRVLNVHGALLPKFGGQGMWRHHVHEAVLAAGETESGCTVHIADHEYDHGPILLQKKVPVLPDDTPETLEARVAEAELEAYPEAIRLMATKLGL
ncbi:MAG TPA: phosphoribosylglycinamide formyltransferase [Dehalococcoidia bacterium]|nr:phosphoribosylglycinamide formyltransferase [Dehalococcoidia bacterium]